jgi:hypothetical protein
VKCERCGKQTREEDDDLCIQCLDDDYWAEYDENPEYFGCEEE